VWILYGSLAAFFAAITSILIKIGLEGVNPNIALAVRTIVIVAMAWGMVFVTGTFREISHISSRNLAFLVGSGLATGASWYFFFRALAVGEVARVATLDKFSVVITIILAAVFLGETITPRMMAGVGLITVGMVLLVR